MNFTLISIMVETSRFITFNIFVFRLDKRLLLGFLTIFFLVRCFVKFFYHVLEQHKINVYFFTWFELFFLEEGIDNPFATKMYLDANVRISTKWKTIKKEIIKSIHPPVEVIKITHSKENIEKEVSPFKSINNLIEQRKYINNLHN